MTPKSWYRINLKWNACSCLSISPGKVPWEITIKRGANQ